jgi:hypothetical protein
MMLPVTKLLPPHPLQVLLVFTLRICELLAFLIVSFVDFRSSMPNVNRARFSITLFDNECGPSNCPEHLIFTNEEGVVGRLSLELLISSEIFLGCESIPTSFL